MSGIPAGQLRETIAMAAHGTAGARQAEAILALNEQLTTTTTAAAARRMTNNEWWLVNGDEAKSEKKIEIGDRR
jgi:hypothetical protein